MTTMKNLDRKVDFAITIGIVAVILILLHLYYSYYGHCSLFATNCHDSNSNINLTAALEKEGWTMECVNYAYPEPKCSNWTVVVGGRCTPCDPCATRYEIRCENPCTAYTWRKEATDV